MQSDDLTAKTMMLYMLLGVAISTILASAVQLYRFYNAASKDQSEYEQLKAEIGMDLPEVESADDTAEDIIIVSGEDAKIAENNEEQEKADLGFDLISTASSLVSPLLLELIPIDDPTVPAIIPMRELNTDASAPQQSGTATTGEAAASNAAEPLIIKKSTDGLRVDWPALYRINPHIIGWIRIEGTIVDYPVVQYTDNEYYLTRNFRKGESSGGCLFMDYSGKKGDPNTVIYGHNLGRTSQSMFTCLLEYYDPAYFRSHRYIMYDTIHESGRWEIIAVYKFDVNNINSYNYTQQQFGSDIEFSQFVKKMKEFALYDTGVSAQPGDKLLTLSTCDRDTYGKTGRCVIVAKKI